MTSLQRLKNSVVIGPGELRGHKTQAVRRERRRVRLAIEAERYEEAEVHALRLDPWGIA